MKLTSRALAMLMSMLAVMIFSVSNAFAAIGEVDWTNAVIRVTGQGMASPNAVNSTHARMLAKRAAVADAYRQLAEEIKGVNVEAGTNVEMMMVESDSIRLKVATTIKGAVVVSEREIPGDAYEVVMEVPLYGVSSNSLAPIVMPRSTTRSSFPQPVQSVQPSEPTTINIIINNNTINNNTTNVHNTTNNNTTNNNTTNNNTTNVENKTNNTTNNTTNNNTTNVNNNTNNSTTVTTPTRPSVATQPAQPSRPSTRPTTPTKPTVSTPSTRPTTPSTTTTPTRPTTPAISTVPTTPSTPSTPSKPSYRAVGGFTGLVVDCRGLGLKPLMSPVIKNADGDPIYGYKNLDYDKIIEIGVVGYSSDVNNLARAGSNPLVVKAVTLENHNGNPVISVADANRVLIENQKEGFLEKMNVVFLR